MNARILSEPEHASWDEWLRTVEGSSIRQTSIYRRALELYGHRSEILVLEGPTGYVAGALLGIKSAGPVGGPIVHASGGIAVSDPASAGSLHALLEALLERCSELKASSIELSSRITRMTGEEANPGAPALEAAFRACEFEPARELETYQVDLSRSTDEALLESFGKGKRRDIRKALREGLTVERAVEPGDFAGFEDTHRAMCARKGLDPFPRGFCEEVLLPMSRAGHCDLYLAGFQGTPRNYLLVGTVSMPIYTWGALSESAKEQGCPPTGEALQYAAMCRYRAMGQSTYDLGGTPGPVPQQGHPNYHVWKFKHEFGGRYVTFLGFWKRTLRPTSAALIDLGRKAVGIGRRLGRR